MNKQFTQSPPPPPPTTPQPTLRPWYQQQVAWPNYQNHPLTPPPFNPQIITLSSENSEQDLENPKHLMKIFRIGKGVVGLQIEVNFWETTNTNRELHSMVIPLKMHDTVLMDRTMSWKEWDKLIPCSAMVSQFPLFLILI